MSERWDGHGYTGSVSPEEETVIAKTLDPYPYRDSDGRKHAAFGPPDHVSMRASHFAPDRGFEQDETKYWPSVVSPEPEQPNERGDYHEGFEEGYRAAINNAGDWLSDKMSALTLSAFLDEFGVK